MTAKMKKTSGPYDDDADVKHYCYPDHHAAAGKTPVAPDPASSAPDLIIYSSSDTEARRGRAGII
jgi:hypothetical protein